MAKNLGALSLLGEYSGDSDADSSENEIVEQVPISPITIVSQIISRDIIPKVVKANLDDSIMVIDTKPAFEVYRGRKREMSECSSVITVKSEASSSSSSSSSEESSSDEADASDMASADDEEKVRPPKKEFLRVKGELLPTDLPPIEDLQISVPEEECFQIGTVASCVESLVVVETLIGTPALDLDSVLFLERGHKTLGKIFDVIGPIQNPLYCVRFNSSEHIKEKDISPGLPVYFAPRTEHTAFIFLEQLKRLKGTDASWRHDIEAPVSHADFSDDEAEVAARKARKANNSVLQTIANSISGVAQPQPKRPAYKPPSRQMQSNNAFYSRPQQQQQQQQPHQSGHGAFFRTKKRYQPQDFGPVQWNSVHTQHLPHISQNMPPPAMPPHSPYSFPPPPGAHPQHPPSFTTPPPRPQFFAPPPPSGCSSSSFFGPQASFPPTNVNTGHISVNVKHDLIDDDLRPPGTD